MNVSKTRGIRHSILSFSRMHGVYLHPAALKVLTQELSSDTSEIQKKYDIDRMLDEFFKLFAASRSSSKSSAVKQDADGKVGAEAEENSITLDSCRTILEKMKSLSNSTMSSEVFRREDLYLQGTATDVLRCIRYINILDLPRLQYHATRSQWVIHEDIQCDANEADLNNERLQLMQNRFEIVLHRLRRHPLFETLRGPGESSVVARIEESTQLERDRSLFTASDLEGIPLCEGRDGNTAEFFVCGILSKPNEQKWVLEDARSSVEMVFKDNSQQGSTAGYILNGAVAIVKAHWNGEKLMTSAVGLPPGETRRTSLRSIPKSLAVLGNEISDSRFDLTKDCTKIVVTEIFSRCDIDDINLFLLSDICIDLKSTQGALTNFFGHISRNERTSTKHEGYVPQALVFVFCGPFFSGLANLTLGEAKGDSSAEQRKVYEKMFFILFDIVKKASPNVAEFSQFYFIPAPSEIVYNTCGTVFPQMSVPHSMIQAINEATRVPRMPTSNPSRFKLIDKEIVIMRDSVWEKMNSEALIRPKSGDYSSHKIAAHEHVVKTVIDLSHLHPYRTAAYPTIWNLDHTLRLFPLPNVLMLCDHSSTTDCWECMYQECLALNPGSFKSTYSFLSYHPSTGRHAFKKADTRNM